MKKRSDIINRVRRTQTTISVLLFFIILVFCWEATKLDLSKMQLSNWGGYDAPHYLLWNSVNIILAVSIFVNNFFFTKLHNRLKNKKTLYILFGLISFSLFMLSVFNLENRLVHNLFATIYFLTYPLAIFVMAFINRKTLKYKEWLKHFVISLLMIGLPLLCFIIFDGLVLPELIHTFIVILWNLMIAFRRLELI